MVWWLFLFPGRSMWRWPIFIFLFLLLNVVCFSIYYVVVTANLSLLFNLLLDSKNLFLNPKSNIQREKHRHNQYKEETTRSFFNLLSPFWKNKRRLTRSPCCVCVCVCPLIPKSQNTGTLCAHMCIPHTAGRQQLSKRTVVCIFYAVCVIWKVSRRLVLSRNSFLLVWWVKTESPRHASPYWAHCTSTRWWVTHKYGAFDGTRIGRRNHSIRIKPIPVLLFPS
jgi:hypothetical protein